MSGQQSDPATAQRKALRERFGLDGAPIPCTKVYRRPMSFDHGHVNAQSWILVHETEGTRTHLNTYDGKLGRNVSAADFTYPLKDEKGMKKALKGYEEVTIAECPVAIDANAEAQSTDVVDEEVISEE